MENNEGTNNINTEKGVSQIDINEEMREAYLQYSMSVIVGRALPDVRDGLKPVHRRILYAMNDLSNYHDKPYKKSARVVGDVIGKYHPHGDTAVYDSMVRMAQEFSLREPLVDGQGNFGSIDGDSPAAQRYTEVRMTRLAEALLEDIGKETVDFGPNYDDSLQIPLILPAKFPNLLVNGSSGIAVGMATNIPPHNLVEVCDGCLHLIENPEASIDDLIKLIPGPDFPTGAMITGRAGIMSAYRTGKGSIKIKAVTEIVEDTKKNRSEIIVTELPYQVNKAKLIESIAQLVRDKRIEGISDIKDESSREGIRVVIKTKRDTNGQVLLNQLFKMTQLQTNFGINLLALDGKNKPHLFNIREVLASFIEHRKDVVIRRCLFDLKKAEDREHILFGLSKALDHIDEVIKIIRGSQEASDALMGLMTTFSFSKRQAQAILDMRLQRLTGLEKDKIEKELAEVKKTIEWLKKVLSDIQEVLNIISEELTFIKEKFGNKRRTEIEDAQDDFEFEDLVSNEEVLVTLTASDKIKRIDIDEYRVQKRGGKGVKGAASVEEDFIRDIVHTGTLSTLLVFSDKGKVYWSRVHALPKGSRTSKGKSIKNVVQLSGEEQVTTIMAITDFKNQEGEVLFVTKNGIVKRTNLDNFSKPRTSGLIAANTDEEDSLVNVRLTTGEDDVFLITRNGMSIRFDEKQIRSMGRTARGVKGINLSEGDEVVGAAIASADSKDLNMLIITDNGFGKRTSLEDYRTQSRGGVGLITQKITDKVGKVVKAAMVQNTDQVIITTNKGQAIRVKASDISIYGRSTQGLKIINLNSGETVTGMTILPEEEVESTEEEK
ncbi:MAG: DNA gyrase subunit A [Bdellovibrionales bacterium]